MVDPEYTQEELSTEEWRPVVGYEGWYSVSNLGRVRRERPASCTRAGRLLKPQRNQGPRSERARHAYYFVRLYRGDGVQRPAYVAALVAAAFIGPRPDGYEVNHKDENKLNNRATNLEYLTKLQNARHSAASSCGERASNVRLTADQVRAIRREYAAGGTSYPKLGRKYGCTHQSIYDIVRRKNWKSVA